MGATMKTTLKKKMDGFALVEAMVALLILGFGLIAVAKLQSTLMENSGLSKQRTEATRLAQEKMEQLRSFEQLNTATGKFAYADIATTASDVVSGYSSNTSYTRSWTATDSTNALYKSIFMSVAWTDRNGVGQTVKLDSMVTKLDPKASGSLIVPPAGSPVKKPKGRDLNIPVPAVDLGGGKSGFTPPGASDFYYVFDNLSGLVTARCAGTTGSYSEASCPNDITAYLVSGFIRFDTTNNPSASSPSSARMVTHLSMTLSQSAASPNPAWECYDDSSPATPTYPDTVTYTCLVYPLDHDNNSTTPPIWSGTSNLTGIALGTTSSTYKVCRYSFDYNGDGLIDNPEHPAQYTAVNETLENQNLLVIKGSEDCPDDDTAINAISHPVNYNTVQHQP